MKFLGNTLQKLTLSLFLFDVSVEKKYRKNTIEETETVFIKNASLTYFLISGNLKGTDVAVKKN